MASSQYAVDDSAWREVVVINGYAVFMGYLMMGVRGLGLLVVTWTTVVLLGGFVSNLQKKDFWCLTGITLIQTAGVFNFLLKEKLSDMKRALFGLANSVFATVKGIRGSGETKNIVITLILAGIQVLVLVLILLPLGVLYMLGLYISTGVSLWRLIEHDFGNEGGANQKPALQVLYGLAVAQGVLFCYKTIHALGATNRLAKLILEDEEMEELLVTEYLEETVAGCEKDPSFATGWNLVTYGVDLMMEAKSNDGFIAGVRVLGSAIDIGGSSDIRGRKVLVKHLLTRSGSSSHMIQRLIETVGPRSPYSREVREHAMKIVALVASGIRLDQFPGMIDCISSVLDPSEESLAYGISPKYVDEKLKLYKKGDKLNDYERVELLQEYELDYLIIDRRGSRAYPCFLLLSGLIKLLVPQCLLCKRKTTEAAERKESQRKNTVHGFDKLLIETMNIILQLALDEGNRRIMSNTVLHKIAKAPLKLHRGNHDFCRAEPLIKWELWILETCLVLVTEWHAEESSSQGHSTLVNETISNIKSTIKNIFDCLDCGATQKMEGILILLHISRDDDMSFFMDNESRTRRLIWILLLAYQYTTVDSDQTKFSDRMIYGRFTNRKEDLSSIRSLAGEKLSDILGKKHEQLVRLAAQDLTSAFADDAQDISIRTHAAIVMEGLLRACCLNGAAEGILLGVVPKVVKEILIRCEPTVEARQARATDLEEGVVGVVSQDDERLRKALVSLCLNGYMKRSWLVDEFKKIASKTCEEQGKSFKYFKSLLV